MDIEYKVAVRCMTYNHASFIKETMNGFCMQSTSFPYVCIIVDDASTDGEQSVINTYLQEFFDLADNSVIRKKETDDYYLTFARHKTNQNCYFAVYFLKYNHYKKKSKNSYLVEWMKATYVAICEGDDYWVDPLKLQKQVDFLDGNMDVSVCCGGYQRCEEGRLGKTVLYGTPNNQGFYFTLEDNFKTWYTQPLTCMFRSVYFHKIMEITAKDKYKYPARDTVYFYHLLNFGKGYYFQTLMGIYNIHSGGVFSMTGGQEKALTYSEVWSELYYKNQKDPRIRPILFKWMCIKIQECGLSVKETMPLIKEAQRLVSSIKEESILLQAVMFWIKRKVIR